MDSWCSRLTDTKSCVFFFFKQKTAYEMRMSDWSSDVCSSDLGQEARAARHDAAGDEHRQPEARRGRLHRIQLVRRAAEAADQQAGASQVLQQIGRAHV